MLDHFRELEIMRGARCVQGDGATYVELPNGAWEEHHGWGMRGASPPGASALVAALARPLGRRGLDGLGARLYTLLDHCSTTLERGQNLSSKNRPGLVLLGDFFAPACAFLAAGGHFPRVIVNHGLPIARQAMNPTITASVIPALVTTSKIALSIVLPPLPIGVCC
jgi:hypothetical protein